MPARPRRRRHAVRQAEQDEHEAEGALAEGRDDLADGDALPCARSITPRSTTDAL
jgi:hypothetical protein